MHKLATGMNIKLDQHKMKPGVNIIEVILVAWLNVNQLKG